MEFLSTWILKLFSVHFLSIAYIATAIAFGFLYIPQIIRLIRDTTGAAAISLFSSTSMVLTRTIPLLYAVAVSKDWIMALSVLPQQAVKLRPSGRGYQASYKLQFVTCILINSIQ